MQRTFTAPLALLAAFVLVLPAAAYALREDPQQTEETDAERKEKKVRRLVVAMNTRELMEKVTKASSETFAKLGLPASFGETFVERFDYDRMIDATVDVYVEKLEEKTIDALIAFHESEQGKIYVAALPEITLATMKTGQEYGEELATDIANGK